MDAEPAGGFGSVASGRMSARVSLRRASKIPRDGDSLAERAVREVLDYETSLLHAAQHTDTDPPRVDRVLQAARTDQADDAVVLAALFAIACGWSECGRSVMTFAIGASGPTLPKPKPSGESSGVISVIQINAGTNFRNSSMSASTIPRKLSRMNVSHVVYAGTARSCLHGNRAA